ncbi:MAG: metallophosphoesterase [Candidatus Obscuribacterales bacterium]|nr:metallophosphoesterase [Candidatus Obscuribacterales bacterium]
MKTQSVPFAKKLIRKHPFRNSMILLLLAVFATFAAVSSPLVFAESEVFVVKPYLQLGNSAQLKKSEQLEIVWGNVTTKAPQKWSIEWQGASEKTWRKTDKVTTTPMPIPSLTTTLVFSLTRATIDGLKPGTKFNYRVLKNNEIVFESHGMARKSAKQAYRFAVVGDIGAGSPGQTAVVNQMELQKPDFLVIPGDIVYNSGRVAEYLVRFFPILNSDTSAANRGAPLIRSTLTMGVIGNHDIALTNAWEGTDFSTFRDALGYYLFFFQPLNGPNKIANSPNSTRIVGNADNQKSFIDSAGQRFPCMANYSFDYGNSHWLVLDGNSYMDWSDPKLRQWVDDDLARSKATWKFACFHQPAFSVDEVHSNEQRMRLLVDIFERRGVDVVFAGHAHCYQRTFPIQFKQDNKNLGGLSVGEVPGKIIVDKNFDGKTRTTPQGIIHIVTGGGGAKLYNKAPFSSIEPWLEKYVYAHCFTICDINGTTLKLSQIGTDGNLVDQFKITKSVTVGAADMKGAADTRPKTAPLKK